MSSFISPIVAFTEYTDINQSLKCDSLLLKHSVPLLTVDFQVPREQCSPVTRTVEREVCEVRLVVIGWDMSTLYSIAASPEVRM